MFSSSEAARATEKRERMAHWCSWPQFMMTHEMLNMHHITPNSKRWDYSDTTAQKKIRIRPFGWKWPSPYKSPNPHPRPRSMTPYMSLGCNELRVLVDVKGSKCPSLLSWLISRTFLRSEVCSRKLYFFTTITNLLVYSYTFGNVNSITPTTDVQKLSHSYISQGAFGMKIDKIQTKCPEYPPTQKIPNW